MRKKFVKDYSIYLMYAKAVKKRSCVLMKRFYFAKNVEKEYKTTLSKSHEGLNMTMTKI